MAPHDHADALKADAMQGEFQRAVGGGWMKSSILGGEGAASDPQL